MKSLFATALLLILTSCSATYGQNSTNSTNHTSWGAAGAAAYEQSRHGPDGAVFLDPYFTDIFDAVEGKQLLDAGCGAGPWSIAAAQCGATAYGLDIQQPMIDRAKDAATRADVAHQTLFVQGCVSALAYPSDFFDVALSINVGCNLSNTVFSAHFEEIYRTLKPGGTAVVTAPASFDVVFTLADPSDTALEQIAHQLEQLPNDPSPQQITTYLNPLANVLRATFAFRHGRLTLVTNESALAPGEPIWRKIPGLAVPNNYHHESDYIEAATRAGLVIDRIDRPTGHQDALCPAYETHHAFIIFHLSKPGPA